MSSEATKFVLICYSSHRKLTDQPRVRNIWLIPDEAKHSREPRGRWRICPKEALGPQLCFALHPIPQFPTNDYNAFIAFQRGLGQVITVFFSSFESIHSLPGPHWGLYEN